MPGSRPETTAARRDADASVRGYSPGVWIGGIFAAHDTFIVCSRAGAAVKRSMIERAQSAPTDRNVSPSEVT